MADEIITIDVDEEVQIPLIEVLAGRGFITGQSGGGKSNSASVFIEAVLDRGRPLLIVDTDGEYYGLKSDYEVLHVGAGDDVDYRVGPEHAEWIAEKALYDGIPVILDVSEYIDTDEAKELIDGVVGHLFREEKEAQIPFPVIVEEIHEYVPQSGSVGDVGETLIRVAKRGRKRGLGIVGISQRPANVDKDLITQANWVLWHRLKWDSDTNVVRDVVNPETANAVKNLTTGEAFLVADFDSDVVELEPVIRLMVRRKRTFDAAETPDLEGFERPELKSIGEDLGDELEEISQRQQRRQDEIERLQSVIERKESEIDDLEEELERERIASSTAERIADAVAGRAGGDSEAVKEQIQEIREEKNEDIRELQSERDSLQERLEDVAAERDELSSRVDELEDQVAISANIEELEEAMIRMNDALDLDVDGGDEKLRERLREREQRIDALESKLTRAQASAGGVDLGEFDDYEDFLDHPAVDDAIESAKSDSRAVDRYVTGIIVSIIDEGGPVSYEEVADRLGVSDTSNISSKGATQLETRGVIEKTTGDRGQVLLDLNIGGIEEIIRKREKQERTEELMERFQ